MKRLLFAALLAALLGMQGCAVVPMVATTGMSFAVPQTVSVAFTGVKAAHRAVLYAADERNTSDMIGDQLAGIQLDAALLRWVDVEGYCYNGEAYLVGRVDSLEDRDVLVAEVAALSGIHAVKGVVKVRDDAFPSPVENLAIETSLTAELVAKLHVRSANVEAEEVDGEVVGLGVVADAAEERELLAFVRSRTDLPVTSLVVRQEEFEAGLPDHKRHLAFAPRALPGQRIDAPEALPAYAEAEAPAPVTLAAVALPEEFFDAPAALPEYATAMPEQAALAEAPAIGITLADLHLPPPAVIGVRTVALADTPVPAAAPTTIQATLAAPAQLDSAPVRAVAAALDAAPQDGKATAAARELLRQAADGEVERRSAWQNARAEMQDRLLDLSRQADGAERTYLITVAHKIATDQNTSILVRLTKAVKRATDPDARRTLQNVLASITPKAPERPRSLLVAGL